MQPEDAELVAQCLEGDRDALERLVGRHQRLVFGVTRRMVRRVEDARDVSQTVFLKVLENLGRFDKRHTLKSWITRIAINECLDHLAKRRAVVELDASRPSPERDPEQVVRGIEVSGAVDEAVRRLQPDYRAVVVLRHFLELSYGEMADILEIPEKTVKSRLFTARQLLREALVGREFLG